MDCYVVLNVSSDSWEPLAQVVVLPDRSENLAMWVVWKLSKSGVDSIGWRSSQPDPFELLVRLKPGLFSVNRR